MTPKERFVLIVQTMAIKHRIGRLDAGIVVDAACRISPEQLDSARLVLQAANLINTVESSGLVDPIESMVWKDLRWAEATKESG